MVLPIVAFYILFRRQYFYAYYLKKKRALHDFVAFETSRYYNKQNLKYFFFYIVWKGVFFLCLLKGGQYKGKCP